MLGCTIQALKDNTTVIKPREIHYEPGAWSTCSSRRRRATRSARAGSGRRGA
eukprot:UN03617